MTSNDKVEKYLRQIADHGGVKWAITRGFYTGMFTAIGLIFGTALIIFIGSNFLTDLRQIPLVNSFLRETKLDVLIENEVNKITNSNDVVVTPETPVINQPITNTYAKFSNDEFGLEFFYPSNLNSITTNESATEVTIKGDGQLEEIKIFKNANLEVDGKGVETEPASNVEFGQLEISIYKDGTEVSNRNIPNPTYITKITKGQITYVILGIADKDSASIGREVFIKIVESFKTVSAD